MAVSVFIEDDPGYLSWLEHHPAGWVLNTDVGSPGSTSHHLHRATCRTISQGPARGDRWTHDLLKACGDEAAVVRFGEVYARRPPARCQLCT